MGLPPHIPVFIDCPGNVSGVFAAPTYINGYGGVVAVVREGLDIASVTRGNLYIGETQAERILLDSYGDDPVAFHESTDGLFADLNRPMRYGMTSPGIKQNEEGYRVDKRYPPLPDILLRCSRRKAVLIDAGEHVYLSQSPLPTDAFTPDVLIEGIPDLMKLVREHVRA